MVSCVRTIEIMSKLLRDLRFLILKNKRKYCNCQQKYELKGENVELFYVNDPASTDTICLLIVLARLTDINLHCRHFDEIPPP